MNKTIFHLEGVNCLQIIRLSGLVEIYGLKDDKVEVKTKQDFILIKDRFKMNKNIFMIAREIRKSKHSRPGGKK